MIIEVTLKAGELYSKDSIAIKNTAENVPTIKGESLDFIEIKGTELVRVTTYKYFFTTQSVNETYIFDKDSILKLEIK